MGDKTLTASNAEMNLVDPEWKTLPARIEKGYRVASGPSDAYLEYGSIEKQKPYFKKLGLNLDSVFNGTLNISIKPYEFVMSNPEYNFKNVKWTELTDAEDFSFSRCKIKFHGKEHEGWVYYPDPKTKKDHFQDISTMEVLAPFIEGIRYGDSIDISLNAEEIQVITG